MKKLLVGALMGVVFGGFAGLSAAGVATTKAAVLNDISYGYKVTFADTIGKANFIKSTSPNSIVGWSRIESLADDFITTNAAGDKDLLNPWNEIKKEDQVIMGALAEWNKTLAGAGMGRGGAGMGRSGGENLSIMAREESSRIKDSTDSVNLAIKAVKKTTFIRTAKKEAAAVLMSFADSVARVGNRLAAELKDLK